MAGTAKSDATGFGMVTEKRSTVEFSSSEDNKATPIRGNDRGGQNMTTLPPEYANLRTAAGEFNMSGNVIRQAVVGQEGPVTLNQTTKVFEAGATDARYHITGGDFSQANIGGKAIYNNEKSIINGEGKVKPEEFVLLALDKGLKCDQFIQLLERNYSLAQIAFSIPDNEVLRERMIKAMLLD